MVHYYQKSIISRYRTYNMVKAEAVYGLTGSTGAAGQSLDYDEILSRLPGNDSLLEYPYKPLRNRPVVIIAGYVFIASVPCLALDELQLSYVSRYCSLRYIVSCIAEQIEQLILSLNLIGLDDLEYLVLS